MWRARLPRVCVVPCRALLLRGTLGLMDMRANAAVSGWRCVRGGEVVWHAFWGSLAMFTVSIARLGTEGVRAGWAGAPLPRPPLLRSGNTHTHSRTMRGEGRGGELL